MNKSCRILVSLRCNYTCGYCCNKIPGILDQFKVTTLKDLDLTPYDDVCISGGEPFLKENIETVREIATLAHSLNKKVYIYTNLSVPLRWSDITLFDGWNVSYHSSQAGAFGFRKRVLELLEHSAQNVRVQIEDTEVENFKRFFGNHGLPDSIIKPWTRNQCNKQHIEDWFILG